MYEDGDGEMMRKMELFAVGGEQVAMSLSGVAIVDGEDGCWPFASRFNCWSMVMMRKLDGDEKEGWMRKMVRLW